jgi:hypothetical protein
MQHCILWHTYRIAKASNVESFFNLWLSTSFGPHPANSSEKTKIILQEMENKKLAGL